MDRSKLEWGSEPGKLKGCEPSTKGWRVLLDSGAVVIRYDCKFAEQVPGDESEDDSSKDDAASAAAGEDDTEAAEKVAQFLENHRRHYVHNGYSPDCCKLTVVIAVLSVTRARCLVVVDRECAVHFTPIKPPIAPPPSNKQS
jgi:hypothetical protein